MSVPLTSRNIIFLRLLGAIWLAAGGVFLALAARQASGTIRSLKWPGAIATVIDAQVIRRPRTGKPGSTDSVSVPLVRYRYTIDGVLYHSTRVAFPQLGSGTAWSARSTVAAYHPGQIVTAYFDPEQPADSVLERGLSWLTIAVLFTGAILVGVGGRWLRTRAPRTSAPPTSRAARERL